MRSFLRIAAIVYIAYLGITLLIISPALNFLPHWYMHDTYGRELRTGWVLLNPFKISLDVSDAELGDDHGGPFVAFGEASINLSLETLWRKGWVFDTVKIQNADVVVIRQTESEFNFSDLLPNEAGEEPPEASTDETPGVTVHDLDLHVREIVLTDNAREKPYGSQWQGLHLRVKDLSTVVAQGQPYSLDLEGEGGGKLHWEGTLSIPNRSSDGFLRVSNLNLRNVWRFAEPWLQFELKDGRLAVQGKYAVDWNDPLRYQVSDGQVSLTVIDIVPNSPDQLPETAVSLHELKISGIALDSTTQHITINAITVEDIAVATTMEESQVSLQRLFIVELPGDSTGEESNSAHEDTEGPGWSVALNKAQLLNSSLHWRSPFTDPPLLEIQPVEATVENITWPLSGETALSLMLSANEQANIAVNGALALAEGNGTIEYTFDGLPLAWFNPNLPVALKASITGGAVQVEGQVTLHEFAPATIALGGAIENFSASREGVETELTSWNSVRFDELAVDMEQHSLALKKLSIDTYIGRLHIAEDGSINASNIWKEEVGEQAQQIAEELTEDKPWSFNIPTILINDSEIDFMDQSLPINFRTVIGELEGEILNISSLPGAAAKVEIKGSVDGYAPVALTGKVSPFATPTDLDLNLSFNAVEMALLSPYSGTYAGYKIDRGLLDLDLHYSLKDNQLQGHNAIRIDKMKLGEKISSDKAVDLPLELALAIMTDSDGVIDIQVPVAGDVNDPEFQLGGVITTAFLNIITKAITAPFTLLANLVGSDEDLQRIVFHPGSTQLSAANKEKLTQLTTALNQRPKLALVITGRLNLTADLERMRKNVLKAQLLESGLSAQEVEAKGADWDKAIARRYEALPVNTAITQPLTPREQYLQVAQSIDVSDQQLNELAQQRALSTKLYLVEEAGLAPDRAVIGSVTLDEESNEFSGVELQIEN